MIDSKHSQHATGKRFIRLGCFCLSPGALLIILFSWYLWNAASRYDNGFDVLSAMFKLQFAGKQIVSVGGRSDILLVKVQSHQATLDRHLAAIGWSRVDWMGAEGQSRKGNQNLRIVNAPMTRYFRIIGLGKSPYVVRGS